MDDFEHKKRMFTQLSGKMEEDELAKRLGLKPWEIEHFKKTMYGKSTTDARAAGFYKK